MLLFGLLLTAWKYWSPWSSCRPVMNLAAQEHLLHEQRDRLQVAQLFGSALVHAELVLVRPHPAMEEGL